MDKNNQIEDADLAVNCEDEEMMQYKAASLNVLTFRIVRTEKDLDTLNTKSDSFHPDMAHQVFGDSEMIFGYKHVSINLYYLHNSAECYVDLQTSNKIHETDVCKADNILEILNPWLPMNYTLSKEQFKRAIAEEDHTVMFGEVINNFEDDKGKKYKVTLCDLKNEDFKDFHQRFETFIVWFIDGANYIDLEDTRWTIIYVYEEYLDRETNTTHYSPIGFCTVYNFFLYPNLTRPRISQYFILPTHQKRGVGTKFYCAVADYLRESPDSGDITVEEPTEIFQKIRDYCDTLRIYKDLEEQDITICTQNQKRINEFLKRHKICKRQAQRVFDILECLIAHKNGYEEYQKFTKNIKERIANEVQKETRGSKRLCNLERSGIITAPIDKKAAVDVEYNRYIDSLEWPTTRLRAYLAKAST